MRPNAKQKSIQFSIRSSSAFLVWSTVHILWRIFWKQTLIAAAASTQTQWKKIGWKPWIANIWMYCSRKFMCYFFGWWWWCCNAVTLTETHTHKQTKEWKKKSNTATLALHYICVQSFCMCLFLWTRRHRAALQCLLYGLSLSLNKKTLQTKHNPCFRCGCCGVIVVVCHFLMPCQHFVAFQFSNSVSVRYYSSLCECTDAHVQTPYCHPKQPEEEEKKKKNKQTIKHSFSFGIVFLV